MSTSITTTTAKELESYIKQVKTDCKGETPGIISEHLTDKLKAKVKEAVTKSKQEAKTKHEVGATALYVYNKTLERDLKYCNQGRKFMRGLGMQSRIHNAYGRAVSITNAEFYKDK